MSIHILTNEEFNELWALTHNLQIINGNCDLAGRGGSAMLTITCFGEENSNQASLQGMFQVVKKDSSTVTVQGYNADAGRNFNNYVVLDGNETDLIVAEADVIVTSAGWIYLDVYYSDSAFHADLAFSATYPQSTISHSYTPIAYVNYSSLITSIVQFVTGAIKITGKVL